MSGEAFVLAIDQGTTSTRAILFDREGNARRAAQVPLAQIYPAPGWVEHDPEEIWRSVVETARAAIEQAKGALMLVYRISADAAFEILLWRSQQTNTKLRALARQVVAELDTLRYQPDSLRREFDHLLLTVHDRVGTPRER